MNAKNPEDQISLAELFYEQQDYEKALEIYLSVINTKMADDRKATQLNNVGLCYFQLEMYEKAAEYFQLFLDQLNTIPDRNRWDVAIAHSNIGDAFSWNNQKVEAICNYKNALEIYAELEGENGENQAYQNINIANCLNFLEQYNNAEPYYLAAKKHAEISYGTENDYTNMCRYNLAVNLYYLGNFMKAYEEFAAVLYFFSDENEYINKIDTLNQLTNLCFELPAVQMHEKYYVQLYEECVLAFGNEGYDAANSAKKSGRYYLRMSDFNKAIDYLRIAFFVFAKLKGELDEATVNIGSFLSEAYFKSGQFARAREYSEYVLTFHRTNSQDNKMQLPVFITNLAHACFRCEDYKNAAELFEEAINLCTSFSEYPSADVINYKCYYIDSLIKLRDYSTASDKIKIYIDEENKLVQPDKIYLSCLYSHMASCLIQIKNRMPEAEIYYRKNIELIAETDPENIEKLNNEKLKLAALFKYRLLNYMEALNVLNEIRGNLIVQQMQNTPLFFQTNVEIAEISNINKRYEISLHFLEPVYELSKDTSKIIDKWRILYYKEYGIAEFGLGNKENAHNFLHKARQLAVDRYGKEIWIVPVIDGLLSEYFGEKSTDNEFKDGLSEYNQFIKNELFSETGRRNVRVFISSTFRDMMAERDYLMKNVFPEIRKTCKEYGIDFTEVDLRWGVTNEEAEQGKVIEICLNEIDRSRPYFIGILGERYGWVPDENVRSKIEKTLENFRWLNRDFDKKLSITEMEIQYGVLRNKKMEGNAFFYMRDKSLTPNQNDFFEKEDTPEHKKLLFLKKTLLEQEKYPVRDFSSIKKLGELIRNDLQKAIIRDSKLDRKLSEHEKFQVAQLNRIKQLDTFYVPPAGSLKKLNDFLASDNNKLVVYSGQGSGKSALLSHWIRKIYQLENHPPVLFHFTGVYAKADTMNGLPWNVSTLIAEIFTCKNNYNPNNENYAGELEKILGNENIRKKLILVIDGLENFIHNSMFAKLYWLPKKFPDNIKLVVSTNSEEFYHILRERNFDEIIPENLEIAQKKKFVTGYLQQFGKKLTTNLVNQLAENKLTDSPLALKIILNEMKLMGRHEDIENELNKLLSANTLVDLYEKVLERVENDFDQNFPGLTGNALSLIMSSTLGLTEHEIMELTGAARLYWSPIQFALEDYLTFSDACISVTDKNFGQAIKNRYLNNEKRKRETREKLTQLLLNSSDNTRKANELAELLFQLDDKKSLAELFTNVFIFKKIIFSGIELASKYYTTIEKEFDLFERIKINIENEKKSSNINELPEQLHWVSSFFKFNLKLNEALFFAEEAYCIAVSVYGENHPACAKPLIDIGTVKIDLKHDSTEILEIFLRAIKIIESENYTIGLDNVLAYTHAAQIYFSKNEFEKTREFAAKAERILFSRFGENNLGLVEIYLLLGNVDLEAGNINAAETRVKKALDICASNTGTESAIFQMVVNTLIAIYEQKEDKKEVIQLLEEQDKIFTDKFGGQHFITTVIKFKIASFYFQNNEIEKAEELNTTLLNTAQKQLDEDSEILQGINELQNYIIEQKNHKKSKKENEFDFHEFEKNTLKFNALLNKCDKNIESKNFKAAIQYLKKAKEINENIQADQVKVVNHAFVLLENARIYYYTEQYEKTIEFAGEASKIFLSANFNNEMLECMYLIGDSFYARKNYKSALEIHKNILILYKKLYKEGDERLARINYDIGRDYYWAEDYILAVKYYKRTLKIRESFLSLNTKETDDTRFELGKSFYRAGFGKKAVKCFKACAAFRKEFYGIESSELKQVQKWLNEYLQ